jgi:hypothetical protein
MSDHNAPIPPSVQKPHPDARMMQTMTGEWLWAVPCASEGAQTTGEARSFFDAGIAAAEVAVAKVSAAGRPSSFALGLAAAGEAIHALFDDDDEAWDAANAPAPAAVREPEPSEAQDLEALARELWRDGASWAFSAGSALGTDCYGRDQNAALMAALARVKGQR